MEFATNQKCREAEQLLMDHGWIKDHDNKTPYPRNMTREQWRKVVAKDVMNGLLSADQPWNYVTCYDIADDFLKEGDK